MKTFSSAAALLAALPRQTLSQTQQCLQGAFTFEFDGRCTPEALVDAYASNVYDATGQPGNPCDASAEDDLVAKLSANNLTLQGLCDLVYQQQDRVPFYDAAKRGTDLHFESMFFNGKGDWQEEVETIYEREDQRATKVLKQDAENVDAFHDGTAQGKRVAWPGSLPNFQSSATDVDGNPTCETSAMMCCWSKDRQANDGNGNCASNTYDENCVDKDPADNTDLCYVDLERGASSTGIEETGFLGYPEDNGNGEGSIHCHGMAWGNDVNDHTARYKANNLFYVAMYDHMYVRGYVKNVPGAPMCGCVEQMPTVSRSDCTQVDLTETIEVKFHRDGTFTTKMTQVHVDFNACRGINNRNNDLWAYMGRLYYEKKVTADQWGTLGRIITDNGCDEATMYHLSTKEGLVRGYDHDQSTFTLVAGRDAMSDGEPWGREAFDEALLEYSLSKPDDPAAATFPVGKRPIIFRVCPNCRDSHKKIYMARITPIPDGFELLKQITNYRGNAKTGNKYLTDYKLYSTYDDAMTDADPWSCPDRNGNGVEDSGDFNYWAPFTGECSPTGARVTNQYSIWSWHHGPQRDVAFYVNKPDEDGIREIGDVGGVGVGAGALADDAGYTTAYPGYTTKDIGYPAYGGRTLEDDDGRIFMTASGNDIWWHKDQFTYFSSKRSGDVEVTVHVSSFSNIHNDYAKAGIMIRRDDADDAPFAFAQLSGRRGTLLTTRKSNYRHAESHGGWIATNPVQTEAYLKLIKKMDEVEFYYSSDGLEWTYNTKTTVIFPDGEFEVGLAVTSHHNGVVSEAVFEDFAVEEYNFPTSAPSVSLAPTPWQPAKVLGDARMGSIWEYPETNTKKYRGYGSGLWGTADSGYYHGVQRDVQSAFDATLYISHFNTGWDAARAGFMIRDSDEPDAANAFVGGAGDHMGITFQSRDVAGGPTASHDTRYVGYYDKAWIKLSKPEGTGPIEGFYKKDPADEWISLGTAAIAYTGDTLQVGVAVSPGDVSGNHYVELTVVDVQITEAGGAPARKQLRA